MYDLKNILSLPPLCRDSDLLFLLSPPAAAICFYFQNYARIFSKYCSIHIGLGEF